MGFKLTVVGLAATWARERHIRRLFVPARDAAEAALASGALTTAEAAIALGKTVLAVPGSVFSALSVGCHQLLRDGAGLVQNARDVLQEIGEPGEVLDDPLQPPSRLGVETAPVGLDPLLVHLTDTLPTDPGTLAARLGLPIQQLLVRLSQASSRGESGGSEGAT